MRSLDDLAVFVSVARAASFVEASRRMRIPPSSVSRAVARLEQDLGVRLLQRTSRKVTLTDEGRQLLLRASAAIDELEHSLDAASDRRDVAAGLIRVTAPAFTGATRVASLLAEFARAHPHVTVELEVSNVVRDLVDERFDLALRAGPLADGDYVARRVWESETGVFASRELAAKVLRKRRPLSKDALESLPAVVTRMNRRWRFRGPDGAITEVAPNARFTVNDPRAAVEVARHGVGIVLAPVDAVPPTDRSLARLNPELGEPVPIQIYAVYPSRKLLPRRVELFLQWLGRTEKTTRSR